MRKTTIILMCGLAITAAGNPLLESQLKPGDKDAVLFTDVNSDGKPDILETWWNGKRCRWFDENGDLKKSDRRGDMVGDSMQVDMDGDGQYDGPSDMNIKWTDKDADGQADLMTVAINPSAKQPNIRGYDSHYMHFVDVDGDGVNHYIDWNTFKLESWRHTGGCNFSPDYNGDSLFIKDHMPPRALTDPKLNWENPFAFYDFDDDGCTEMAIRYLESGVKGDTRNYSGFASMVQIPYDLDNSSQFGQEQSFDLTIAYLGKGVDYRQEVQKYPTLKAPEWVLPYYQYTTHREIDELIYMAHDECFDKTMEAEWSRSELAFDEDGDDHRWERVCLYRQGDPYLPRYSGKKINNKSIARGVQTDSLGDRTEWDEDFSGKGKIYIGAWDNKLHLYGAETGAWLVDDGEFFGSGSAPRAASADVASAVKEVVQYKDTDQDGFIDFITYDYDGDQTVDLAVDLKKYDLPTPELIDPAVEKWQGLHEIFKKMAKQSWQDAQLLYRAAWRAGLTDPKLDELAIASSTWEKYDHGYWLKMKLFRELYAGFEDDKITQSALVRSFFSGDYTAVAELIVNREME